jgi:hypothetical protein
MAKVKRTTKIKRNSISTTVKHTTVRKAKKQVATAAKVSKVPKGLGVIDTIVAVLQAGGGTIPEIVAAAVHKKVPDRKAEQLTATVRVQMARLKLPKEDGGRSLKVKKNREEGERQVHYSL